MIMNHEADLADNDPRFTCGSCGHLFHIEEHEDHGNFTCRACLIKSLGALRTNVKEFLRLMDSLGLRVDPKDRMQPWVPRGEDFAS